MLMRVLLLRHCSDVGVYPVLHLRPIGLTKKLQDISSRLSYDLQGSPPPPPHKYKGSYALVH
jgi:hypothetical protein